MTFPKGFETDTLAVHAGGHSFRLPLYLREVGRRQCLLGHTHLGYLQPFPEGACRLLGVGL